MNTFGGTALFLDRSDINTDEIIPAKYLTEISKQALAPHLLEDLTLAGFDPATDIEAAGVVISRANFGCGSSREHAAWALEVNDIKVVIAESFSRIFRQNMFNCGLLAAELPATTIDHLFQTFSGQTFSGGQVTVKVDLDKSLFIFRTDSVTEEVPFNLAGFDQALIAAGGWVDYADSHY